MPGGKRTSGEFKGGHPARIYKVESEKVKPHCEVEGQLVLKERNVG